MWSTDTMSHQLTSPWYRSPLFWELFLADRLSKILLFDFFRMKPFFTSKFISFKVTVNSGIAWSLFANTGMLGFYILTAIIGIVLCFFAKYTLDEQNKGSSVIGHTLVLAGGLGNFIDRFAYRGVIDFIKISFGGWSFPVFNIADIAITIGIGIMLYNIIFSDDE